MLKKNIETALLHSLPFNPTPGQKELIEKLAEFIIYNDTKEVFIIKGYAGTGKTSMVYTLVNVLNELKIRFELLAPTGRAAKVLAKYSKKPAYTIHKKIYRQKSSKDGLGKFVLNKNFSRNTFFIVDEASMIGDSSAHSYFGSGNLLNDLLEYVYSQDTCKLILIGDTAQLPPVGLQISPALNSSSLQLSTLKCKEHFLTEVVRQSADSGILLNATSIRNILSENKPDKLKFNTSSQPDIIPLNGKDLIEELGTCYDKYGMEETIVVCRSNKRANLFNKGIRNQILWREEELTRGDLLMSVKNNYFWVENNPYLDFIANGDILEIIKIQNYEERYGYNFADAVVKLIDYNDIEIECKLLLNTLKTESASLPFDDMKELFIKISEDYVDTKPAKKKYDLVKSNEYYNAIQIKYAYAITCHKAQGGQWKSVFLDQGYLTADMLNADYLRWLYTGVTRATEKLYLVNFKKEFLDTTE